MSVVEIKFNPTGFAECLSGLSGEVQAAAEIIANRASSFVTKGSGFHVEMSDEARYRDSGYGVTRPVAYVVPDDDESEKEEAEDKILSKAL
jgi:hypothetical protein